MKKSIALCLFALTGTLNASTIRLAKNIQPKLRTKIQRDINLLDSFKFESSTNPKTLKVMALNELNAQTASEWLNKRVNYIISENAFSKFNLLIQKVIYSERSDIDFPNALIIPYSLNNKTVNNSKADDSEGSTLMSNISTALYLRGKEERQIYGLKIPSGFLRASEKVAVTSPRAGIIQIGEGLFSPELAVNQKNPDALANSIFRLGALFHEARHSDGNGLSLGFFHTICPEDHDYAGQPACDENLNGPYTIGALMISEMSKACEDTCSEKDKQTLKILVVDNANRILTKTHKGDLSQNWDPAPESL